MKVRNLGLPLKEVVWGAAVLVLCRYNLVWLALIGVVAREGFECRRVGDWSLGRLTRSAARWIFGLGITLLVALAPKLLTALVLTAVYVAWLIWLRSRSDDSWSVSERLLQAGLTQLAGTSGVFVAATIWGWSAAIVMGLIWLVSFVTADGLLGTREERSRAILAAAWALVASELAWLLSVWRVSYVLLGGYLIIPQAALVLTALGYCFGGIYVSHREGRLSRVRLIEYIVIGLVLLGVVLAGTKWNAAI
jgi:hypothetical protein